MPVEPIRLALLAVPLLALGFSSGALRTLARREDWSPRRRRACDVAWVLLLLVGVPTWLVAAAVLRLW
jgi:hypothetical protein